MRSSAFASIAVGLVLGLAGALPAQAAEILVRAGTGTASAMRDLASAFEKKTKHKVNLAFDQTPVIKIRINANEPADVVVIESDEIDDLVMRGRVVAGTRTNFAQAGVGVVVKAGAPKPDISTVEAFKAAMLAAKSIGYPRGSIARIAEEVMKKLGIGEEMKAKSYFIEGRPVAEIIGEGRIEVGLQQVNVVTPVEGADYVGPLPKELQQTVKFSGGVLSFAKQPEVARAFLKFIASPEAAALIRKGAMEPWS
jgi:molybdate transport system substrate-binding protein